MKKVSGKPKKAGKKRAANGTPSGNVVLGPVVTKPVRVPINEDEARKKEHQLAKKKIEVLKLERKIAPDKAQIRAVNKVVAELTLDLEANTEVREMKVREELDFVHNEIRVMRADDGKVLETRTMTAEERKRQEDVEDAGRAGQPRPTKPVNLSPGEAMAAARAEDDETQPDAKSPPDDEQPEA